jgi:hypothetical protein
VLRSPIALAPEVAGESRSPASDHRGCCRPLIRPRRPRPPQVRAGARAARSTPRSPGPGRTLCGWSPSGALSQKERSSPLYGFAERTSTVRSDAGSRRLNLEDIRNPRDGAPGGARVAGARAAPVSGRVRDGSTRQGHERRGDAGHRVSWHPLVRSRDCADSKSGLGGLSARCTH